MLYLRKTMRIGAIVPLASLFFGISAARADEQRGWVPGPGSGKVFFYTAKKFGMPLLKACVRIGNGPVLQGKSLFQIRVEISSVTLGFFRRINNHFTSTVDSETCLPVQYVKEIDQEGFLRGKKKYRETLTFDAEHQKVIAEKEGEKERREVSLPPETFDPLAMFARCYLKEDLRTPQEIRMAVYDGSRLRQILFEPKEERIKSKVYGELETVRLSTTLSFASFDDKEGTIRIWYSNDGRKIPVRMELDLPVGRVKFELDGMQEY